MQGCKQLLCSGAVAPVPLFSPRALLELGGGGASGAPHAALIHEVVAVSPLVHDQRRVLSFLGVL